MPKLVQIRWSIPSPQRAVSPFPIWAIVDGIIAGTLLARNECCSVTMGYAKYQVSKCYWLRRRKLKSELLQTLKIMNVTLLFGSDVILRNQPIRDHANCNAFMQSFLAQKTQSVCCPSAWRGNIAPEQAQQQRSRPRFVATFYGEWVIDVFIYKWGTSIYGRLVCWSHMEQIGMNCSALFKKSNYGCQSLMGIWLRLSLPLPTSFSDILSFSSWSTLLFEELLVQQPGHQRCEISTLLSAKTPQPYTWLA